MGRIQHRQTSGQFRRGTLMDIGLQAEVCWSCQSFNPYKVGVETKPTHCHACGSMLESECGRLEDEQDRIHSLRDFREMQAGAE